MIVHTTVKKLAAGCLLLLLPFAKSYSQQDAVTALQKIYKAYNTGTAYRFAGSMKMFAKDEPLKILDKLQSSYTVKDKNFLCSIGPVEMMMNDQYYISVDNNDKLILIGYKKNLPDTRMPVLNIEQFKKWVTEKKMQVTLSTRGNTDILELTDPTGISGYNRYIIEYNGQTGYMKKALLETISEENDGHSVPMIVEITYSEPVAVEVTSNLFSEKSFFTLVGNNIQLATNYKSYQIINQL